MAPRYGVDDPKIMNDFLAMIGASPLPVEEDVPKSEEVHQSFTCTAGLMSTNAGSYPEDEDFYSPESDPDLFSDDEDQGDEGKEVNEDDVGDENDEEFGGTPAKIQHRQSTLDTYYAAVANTADAPLQETELPEFFAKMSDPNSSLEDSKYAPRVYYDKIPSRYPVIASRRPNTNTGGSVNKLDYPQERPRTRTTVQQEMLDKIAAREAREAREAAEKLAPTPTTPAASSMYNNNNNAKKITSMGSPFEDDVIAEFKARAEMNDKGKENIKTVPAPNTASKALDPGAMEWNYPADTPSYTLEEVQAQFAKAKEITKAVKTEVTEVTATKNVIVGEAAERDAPPAPHPVATTVASKNEPEPPEEGSSMIFTSSENPVDRENATHFSSWGTPELRTTPRAKVRKIVLRAVPASADLTFVQSVIHGGAIDNFALGTNGTAQVTFTTPEACETYCNKYPNGVVVKFKGRNIVLFVDKTTEVNVVSGMLQGQLEAGASRCVRAVGADHDWGVGALIKLAEGKTRKGKVEHIADTWRNEIRTVIFRFTSIGDAVTFKSMLVRQEDWEGCNIQFMDDPCEKATGVRAE